MASQSTKANWRRRALAAEHELFRIKLAAYQQAYAALTKSVERIPTTIDTRLTRAGFPPPDPSTWVAIGPGVAP